MILGVAIVGLVDESRVIEGCRGVQSLSHGDSLK